MKKLVLLLSIFLFNTNKDLKYCDIKGNIKNPGVYEIKENYTIQDIINDAGGLKKNSYTNNINLSKKVIDEMVIYIFNKNEINELKEINSCICEPIYKYVECNDLEEVTTTITTTLPKTESVLSTTTQTTTTYTTTTIPISTQTTTTSTPTTKINKKININTCSIEELITLKGLGESRAKAIINYRTEVGLFNNIEDIMNVKGIGKSIFENIKDFIEI